MKRPVYIFAFITFFILCSTGLENCGDCIEEYGFVKECPSSWNDFWLAALSYLGKGKYGQNKSNETELYYIAVGKEGMIMVRDGRPPANWFEVIKDDYVTQDLNFIKIFDNPDSLIAYTVGDSGTVLFSGDRGYNWESRSISDTDQDLYGIDYLWDGLNSVQVLVCGDNGTIYKSVPGESWTWKKLNTGTNKAIRSVGAITTMNYLAVGDSGTIIKSNDGGQTWEDVSVGGAHLNRISICTFYPYFSRAWIVGDEGRFFITTDYGYKWQQRNTGTTENLYDLHFRNADEGVVVGANGVVKVSYSSGFYWEDDPQFSNLTSRDIISITVDDTVNASAIMVNNYQLKSQSTDTTFIINISSEPFVVDIVENPLLQEYILHVNYPNPFRNSTRIKYTIPRAMQVDISIVDAFGKEVAYVLCETKPGGTHNLNWNAEGFPEGMYFCRMKVSSDAGPAETRIFTRKMVLMK